MPKLIHEGGFNAAESDLEIPAEGVTRGFVRSVVGVPAVAYPTPTGGIIFARCPTPEVTERDGLHVNLRASELCGILLFGVAIHCQPGEPIKWHDETRAAE